MTEHARLRAGLNKSAMAENAEMIRQDTHLNSSDPGRTPMSDSFQQVIVLVKMKAKAMISRSSCKYRKAPSIPMATPLHEAASANMTDSPRNVAMERPRI